MDILGLSYFFILVLFLATRAESVASSVGALFAPSCAVLRRLRRLALSVSCAVCAVCAVWRHLALCSARAVWAVLRHLGLSAPSAPAAEVARNMWCETVREGARRYEMVRDGSDGARSETTVLCDRNEIYLKGWQHFERRRWNGLGKTSVPGC